MPASLRVIKIVKDNYTGDDAYTVELEIEASEAKELVKEIMGCPYGQRFIELLNRAQFLPEEVNKTPEEIKKEAEAEAEDIRKHDEAVKDSGRREGANMLMAAIRDAYDDEFVKELEAKIAEAKTKKLKKKRKIKKLAGDANQEQ